MKHVRRIALAGCIAATTALASLALETDARAEAPDRVVVVYVEAGSDVDPAEVRGAVAAELGVRVPQPGDPMPPGAGLLHVRSQGGFLRVTFRDARGRTMEREIAAVGDAHARATMIALLAGNLARNEADELVGVEPSTAAEETAPAPAAPPPAGTPKPAAKAVLAPVPAVAAAPSEGSVQRTLGWVGIGAGVASAAIGAGLLVSAKGDMDNLSQTCAPDCADSQLQPVHTKTIAGDAFIGTGVLLGVGGTVLLVTAPSGGPAHEAPASESWQRTAGWIAMGTGAVGVGIGAALRVTAASEMGAVSCGPYAACVTHYMDASQKVVLSNWALALGGAAVATGVVLELTAPGVASGTTVGVGPTGLRVGGTW